MRLNFNPTRSVRTWFYQRLWRNQYSFGNRIAIVLLLIATTVGIGTAGYMLLEGWHVHDALFMTITTMSTVGYGEVHPLSRAGERFTVVLIFAGVGLLAYAFSTIADFIVAGELRGFVRRRRLQGAIDRMQAHYIICGFGRVGREVAATLRDSNVEAVVIEQDQGLVQYLEETGYNYIQGDATLDATLQQAGIDRARGLCTCLPSDADNLFAVLTARMLNPSLYIIARANLDENEEKFKVAGANQTINPYTIAGARMASQLLQPTVAEFLDAAMHRNVPDLNILEFAISRNSPLDGRTFVESHIRKQTGANVLAVRRTDGTVVTDMADDLRFKGGDRLIGLGTRPQLQALEVLARGDDAP